MVNTWYGMNVSTDTLMRGGLEPLKIQNEIHGSTDF